MSRSSSENKLDDLDDETLMMNYRDGTAAAFDVLYTRHKGGLYRYVLRHLNNQPDIANELFQDIWMKLVNARLKYQPTAKFSTYLYHMAHNRLIDYWRSEKHQKNLLEYEDIAESESAEPHIDLHNKQMQKQIKQAISQLPEEQRSALLLKEEASLSLQEIAEVTGVNRETVKSRLRYAVKRLQGILHPLRSVP